MFSLLNRLIQYSPSVLAHLEARLSCSPALPNLTFLRPDETDPRCVVLATWKRGIGGVRRSFPAVLTSDPELVRVLDREIDGFLACCAPEPEVSGGAETIPHGLSGARTLARALPRLDE